MMVACHARSTRGFVVHLSAWLNALQHRVVVVQPLVLLICLMSHFRLSGGLSVTPAPQLPSGLCR